MLGRGREEPGRGKVAVIQKRLANGPEAASVWVAYLVAFGAFQIQPPLHRATSAWNF